MPLLLVAAAVVVLWTDTPFDVDDAMITYRYAENLAAGQGFVYNAGEKVLGTSAPLYAMTLGALRVAGAPVPWASNALGLTSSVAVVALTMKLARLWGGTQAVGLLAGVLLLVQAPFLRYSMAGLETPLYTLLVLGSLWLLSRERSVAAAALASLSVLTRLDGLSTLVAVFLGLAQRRRAPRREALVAAAILVPWVGFCLLYFHSVVPLSLVAKHQHLVEMGASRFWIWSELVWTRGGAPTHLTVFALIGMIRAFLTGWRSSKAVPAVVWFCANVGAYLVVGLEYYEWYVVPLLPVLAAFASVGLLATIEALRHGWRWRWFGVTAMALLVVCLVPYARHARRSVRAFKDYLTCVERSRAEAGQWLRANAAPGSRVFTDAIGHVGYRSGLYILDGGGLVRPAGQDEFQGATHVVAHDDEAADTGPVLKTFETGWPEFPRRVVVRRYAVAEGLRATP